MADESSATAAEQYHSLSMAYQTYLRHDEKEQNHWEDVCRAFRQYASFAMAQWANTQYRLHALPESQRKILPRALRVDTEDFHRRSQLYKEAAIRNQFCLDCILRHAGMPHSQQVLNNGNNTPIVSDGQISKVSSVLKSLARDWSTEGKPERDMAYEPILRQIQTFLPIHRPSNGSNGSSHRSHNPPQVCVPGAGVGRLALEITALGYSVQGNDFSLFMLLASDFTLNGGIATPENPLKISPWLLESRNVHSPTDPLRIVQIPDVDPYHLLASSYPPGISLGNDGCVVVDDDELDNNQNDASDSTTTTNGHNNNHMQQPPNFSMAAGEFASIYSNPKERCKWDAVVCSFFVDTGPSIVEYIQIIYNMLKPNGIWINFGPLLYHWSGPAMRPDDKTVTTYHERYSYLDRRYLNSIDLCWEDVREIIMNVGFDILEERTGVQSLYTADRRSMMNMNYRCLNFVARKRLITAASAPPAVANATTTTTTTATTTTAVRPATTAAATTTPTPSSSYPLHAPPTTSAGGGDEEEDYLDDEDL